MHQGQINLSLPVFRGLVAKQFPRWRHLPIRPVSSAGTVNAIFRIGERLAARLPLMLDGPEATRLWLQAEASAARELHSRLPWPTPEPVAIGEPGPGYPLPWSVQTWVPGIVADPSATGALNGLAEDLADAIRALRGIDTAGRTFSGEGRGGNLRDHDEWMQTCFGNSEGLLDVPRLRRLWSDLRALPPSPLPELMTHGDLTPGNILVARGRLAGLIDVGGLGPADPALDLVCAWHLFDAARRERIRSRLRCSDIEWQRGRAWAFQQSMGLVWYYADTNPSMSRLGRRTLARILLDAEPTRT
jgi:aminoglycoside phosphotransferase (APT) family kinase protein